jgi:hypothetical protein
MVRWTPRRWPAAGWGLRWPKKAWTWRMRPWMVSVGELARNALSAPPAGAARSGPARGRGRPWRPAAAAASWQPRAPAGGGSAATWRDGPAAATAGQSSTPGLSEQPQDALAKPRAAKTRTASPGPVAQAADAVLVVAVDPAADSRGVTAQHAGDLGRRGAVLGQQDHDQPAADAVGAVQQPQQVAGVASRARALGVHAGGTHAGAASWGRCGRKLQRPTRLLRQRSTLTSG